MLERKEQVSRQREEQLRHPERRLARQRVMGAVKRGILPHPTTLHCVDCGGPAAEYDHFLGYQEEFVFAVHPRCKPCHGKRPKAPRDVTLLWRRPRQAKAETVRKCEDCGSEEGRWGQQPVPALLCPACRRQRWALFSVDADCANCGQAFTLTGGKARTFVRNHKKWPHLRAWCPACYGDKWAFGRYIGQAAGWGTRRQRDQPEPDGDVPAANGHHRNGCGQSLSREPSALPDSESM